MHVQKYAEIGANYYHFLFLAKNILWSLEFFSLNVFIAFSPLVKRILQAAFTYFQKE